jgi:hypothetical protein
VGLDFGLRAPGKKAGYSGHAQQADVMRLGKYHSRHRRAGSVDERQKRSTLNESAIVWNLPRKRPSRVQKKAAEKIRRFICSRIL